MFEKCDNCGGRSVRAIRDDRGSFCSQACRSWAAFPRFCERCISASSDVSSGGTATINGIGTKLYGSGDRCPTCNSVIKRLFFCLVYIPLIPLGKFRVKHVTPSRFFSRKIVRKTL